MKSEDTNNEYAEITALFRCMLSDDWWGDTTNFLFDICESLNRRCLYIPDEWEFRAGLIHDHEHDDLIDYFSEETLVRFGGRLFRLSEKLEAQGRRY